MKEYKVVSVTNDPWQETELVAKFSLIYFELESGKSIGFFINKTLTNILFSEVGD